MEFSRRTLLCGLGAATGASLFLAPGTGAAQVRVLPSIQASDLNGRAFAFPRDLAGTPALGIFVYRREEQPEATRVLRLVEGLSGAFPRMMVREFPVISAPVPVRGLIDRGMRQGIASTADRGKVVTLYVPDMAAWRRTTGFANPRGVWLALMDSGSMARSLPSSDLRSEADVRRFIQGS